VCALARGGDHPHERVDGRSDDPLGEQVLTAQLPQHLRALVLDRAQPQPLLKLRAPRLIERPEPGAVTDGLEVVGAGLRPRAVEHQIVGVGLELVA
jgi:hypothetical protein